MNLNKSYSLVKFHAVKYTISLLLALIVMGNGIKASTSVPNCRIIKNDANYSHEFTILKVNLNNNEINDNSDFHLNSLKLHTPYVASIKGRLSANTIFADEIIPPSENKTRIAFRLFSALKM